MSNLKLIVGEAKINKAVDALIELGTKHADQIHLVLCSAFAHVQTSKNVVLIDNVVTKLHQIVNIRGVDAWIRAHTNLRFIQAKGGYRKPEKKPLIINIDAMMAEPFWLMKANEAANRAVQFDVEGRLVSFLNSALKNVAEHKTKQDEKRAMAIAHKVHTLAKEMKIPLDNVEVPEGVKVPWSVKADLPKQEKPAKPEKPARKTAKTANENRDTTQSGTVDEKAA